MFFLPSNPDLSARPLLKKGLWFALIFFMALIAAFGALVWSSYWDLRAAKIRHARIDEINEQIDYLNKMLRTAVQVIVVGEKMKWEDLYSGYLSEREKDSAERVKLMPRVLGTQEVLSLEQAKIAMTAIESSAFEHVRTGRRDIADALIFGKEYEKQHRDYEEFEQKARDLFKNYSDQVLRLKQRGTVIVVIAACILFPIFFCVWLFILSVFYRDIAFRLMRLIDKRKKIKA